MDTNLARTKVLRMEGLSQKIGLRPSTIYELIADGKFPTSFKIVPGGRTERSAGRSDPVSDSGADRPGAQAVIVGTDIAAVIAVGIFVALGHVRRARIGVDVAQHAQGVVGVLVRHSGGMVALFPEMAPPAQQPDRHHGAIPVEPVHQAWHVGGQRRSDQVPVNPE
jgi:hypothetical protein